MNKYLKNLNKIEFVITYACTGRCKHCSEGDHLLRSTSISPDIAAEAVKKVVKEYPIQTVMTFGGEPLLYPNAVYKIHSAARDIGIPKRQLITNGYFSKDESTISSVARMIKGCGINDLLLSADAFHQETIPIDIIKSFAEKVQKESVPIRIQPAWLVSCDADNPYNETTRNILAVFRSMGIGANQGNVIFPEGNALKYLREYFNDSKPQNPYVEDSRDIRCLSFSPDGSVLNGNIYDTDITKIMQDYEPKN